MGCHTWFYKKVKNQPTDEDKIRFFKERQTKWLNLLETAVKDGGFKYSYTDELEWYPYNNADEASKDIEKVKWMLENVDHFKDFEENYKMDEFLETKESELYYTVVYVWKAPIDENSKPVFEDDDVDDLTVYRNGIYYSSVHRYDDCFRYHKYDTEVNSKETTFKLIEDNNIKITDDTRNKLEEFWTLYPDGLIMFG